MKRVLFINFWALTVVTTAWGASPTVATQHDPGIPGVPWSDLANALTDDGATANATLSASDQSTQTLTLSGFGLSLPVDAVITGLEATVEVSADGLSGSTGPILLQAHFTKTGESGEFSSFPQIVTEIDPTGGATFGPTVATVGGANDLWSASWSPAEINRADFSLELRFDKGGGDAAGTVRIDHAAIEVTFVSPSMDAGVIVASRPGPYFEGESLALFAPSGTDYQWVRDGEFIGGANGATLDLAPLTIGDTGNYSVLFSTVTKGLSVAPPFALVVLPAPGLPAAQWLLVSVAVVWMLIMGWRRARGA